MSTNNYAKDCFLCRKHQGLEQQPPGGYIYSDQYWLICHAPPEKGPLGTLFIESKRHFLDFILRKWTPKKQLVIANFVRSFMPY